MGLIKHVDLEALAASVDIAASKPSRAESGRTRHPTVLMIRILVPPTLQPGHEQQYSGAKTIQLFAITLHRTVLGR
jgi:hypothetical protein